MKELVVLSGKGGTGKTSISAALAYLAPAKVLADCDVDAANFHLVVGAQEAESHEFFAGFEPHIEAALCIQCGKCSEVCRFGAVNKGSITAPFSCEGCGVCAFNCPQNALSMRDKKAGRWMVSETRFGKLVHAELGIAVENSGKLVNQVRQQAKKVAGENELPLILTDGPPGIGCPAIASITGADLVLAVVEPSLSGIHDLKRLIELCRHFKMKVAVCINKASLSSSNKNDIICWCKKNNTPIVGELPYDDIFRTAAQQGRSVMECGNQAMADKIVQLWYNISTLMDISPTETIMRKISRKISVLAKPVRAKL